MTTRLRVSRAGIELIKRFEGYRARAARLPGGRYVVGYGHVRSAREGAQVPEADAHALLVYDLMEVETAINEWTFAPLNQHQFDALVSFAFNIGLKSFRRSDVLRRLNEGAMLQAAGALDMWRQADLDGETVVIDALVRRRAAEKALFLTPMQGYAPAPSAVLRPRLDLSAYMSVPRRRPEDVTVPLDGEVAVFNRETTPSVEPVAAPPEAAATPDVLEPETSAVEADGLGPAAADGEMLASAATDSDVTEAEAFVVASVDPDAEEVEEPAFDDAAPGDEPALTTPENDQDWSTARAAAAAVSARLHELLRDEDFEEPEPSHPSPPQSDAAEEVAPFPLDPSSTLRLDDEADLEPFPVTPLASNDEPDDAADLEPFPGVQAEDPADAADDGLEAFPARSFASDAEAPRPVDLGSFEPLPTVGANQAGGPYLLIGLVGLLFIIAALVTLFRSPADGGAADGVSLISWVLGMIGIAGVAGALWFTLGREDHDEDDAA